MTDAEIQEVTPSAVLKEFMKLEGREIARLPEKQKVIYWREKAMYYESMYKLLQRRIKRLDQRVKFMRAHRASSGTKFKKVLNKGRPK